MEVTKFFLSIEKEEKWLNDMSSEGCRFVGKHGFSYKFEPCEKGSYRYCIDQRGFLKNSEEFVGFLDELNMKLVHKQWGFYYFEADRSCSTEKIYTDIKSKSSFYLRCILWLACIGILNISIINHAACPVAYLPLGTLEWHGPHLPLGADGIQSQELFIRTAERIGGIVLPKLFLGPDRFYHDPERELYGMDICTGGTIVPYEMQQLPGSAYWMPDEEYRGMILRIGANLSRAGFKILAAHGHGLSIRQFGALKEELRGKCGLIGVTAFDFVEDDRLKFQNDHAAANETSITMAVRPDLVQLERIQSGGEPPIAVAGADPRTDASWEYGREILETNVDALCRGIGELLKQDTAAALFYL